MARQYREHRIDVDGVQICVFESGTSGCQQVLIVHATGHHARCWDKVVDYLPPDWHVFAVDLRGHGRSDNTPPFSWDRFAQDLLVVAAALGIHDAIGVGHSLGGHCISHICALQPGLMQRLVLVDPVILPPEMYVSPSSAESGISDGARSAEDHPIARRRSHFASWQDMFERYQDRPPYNLWRREIFRDYCEFGVVPSESGEGVDLACPGPVEASIYMTNQGTDIYPLLGTIEQPVVVLRALQRDPESTTMDFSASPTWPELASVFKHGTDIYLPELTHFMPMQEPQFVAGVIQGE